MLRQVSRAALLLSLSLCGCSTGQTTIYSTKGALCVYDEGKLPVVGKASILTDTPNKHLLVEFDKCASGCTQIKRSQCSAVVEGTTIRINANVETFVDTSSDQCPTVCVEIAAKCPIQAPLQPNLAYTLHYGEASYPLTIPGNFQCR